MRDSERLSLLPNKTNTEQLNVIILDIEPNLRGNILSQHYIGVVSLLEQGLQLIELILVEGGAIATLVSWKDNNNDQNNQFVYILEQLT